MTLPYVFATLGGNQPGSTLDDDFNAVAQMGSIFCSSAGTNAITLTPNANQPEVTAYVNDTLFAFNAAATPTAAVTLQVGSLGALNVYYSDGATQISAGAFVQGQFVIVVYLASLNGGAGGFSFVNGALISALLDLQFSNTQGSILYRDASEWKALAPGASGQALVTGGTGENPSWGSTGSYTFFWAQDQKPNGTNGQNLSTGSQNTRNITTVLANNIAGASLTSNQVNLPAGTYNFHCIVSAQATTQSRVYLYNTTTSTPLIGSPNVNLPAGQQYQIALQGQFVLTGATQLSITQVVGTASSAGAAVSSGTVEIYLDLFITKIA